MGRLSIFYLRLAGSGKSPFSVKPASFPCRQPMQGLQGVASRRQVFKLHKTINGSKWPQGFCFMVSLGWVVAWTVFSAWSFWKIAIAHILKIAMQATDLQDPKFKKNKLLLNNVKTTLSNQFNYFEPNVQWSPAIAHPLIKKNPFSETYKFLFQPILYTFSLEHLYFAQPRCSYFFSYLSLRCSCRYF